MNELVITAANSITAVGHDGRMTSAAVRAGIAGMTFAEFRDGKGNPVTVAPIEGIEDGNRNITSRMGCIAMRCLAEMLDQYLRENEYRPSQVKLLLGVASLERPGPRYEESCMRQLLGIVRKMKHMAELQTIPRGNASMQFALVEAGRFMQSSPETLCIIGGIDSLLRDSTLSWFEGNGRLKSDSFGRQHGLIAGEAASFLIVEDRVRAEQAKRPLLARVAGLGVAEEPVPRASNAPSRNSGMTDACRAALDGAGEKTIDAIFGDLNGENSRAREWSMAEIRCFKDRNDQRKLWKPANCYGDIGAASGTVLANIATQGFQRGWLPSPVLIFCSDDHGPCGAVVLERGEGQGEGVATADTVAQVSSRYPKK